MSSGGVTRDDIQRFREDGAVCLRNAISQKWIASLMRGVEANLVESPHSPHFRDLGGDATAFTDMWRWSAITDYAEAAHHSEAGSIAGALLGASEVNFIEEQMFHKKPGSKVATPWHHDLPYYPLTGRMCVVWIPVTPHSAADCLKIVRGSQRIGRQFVPTDFRTRASWGDEKNLPPGTEILRDVASLEREGYEIISWDMKPGDALVFDALTVHGNTGNSSNHVTARVALRFCAEDVRYAPKKFPWVFTQWPFSDQKEGERLRGPMFPVVWKAERATA